MPRLPGRCNARITLIGTTLLAAAALVAAATAAFALAPWVVIAGWALAGAGMGLMYPRLTVLTLAYSTPQNQGFTSSALARARAGAATRARRRGALIAGRDSAPAAAPPRYTSARPSRQ